LILIGRLSCLVIEQVPVAFNASLYVTVEGSASVDCSASHPSAAAMAAAASAAGLE